MPTLPKVVVKPPKPVTLVQDKLPAWRPRRGLSGRFWALWAGLLLVAAGLFGARVRLARWWMPPPAPRAIVLSSGARAQQRYAAGLEAYAQHKAEPATLAFEEALRLDPSLAAAHRSLGILYAQQHAQQRAMWHYQRYVDLAPQAADAAAVRQLIGDYYKARK